MKLNDEENDFDDFLDDVYFDEPKKSKRANVMKAKAEDNDFISIQNQQQTNVHNNEPKKKGGGLWKETPGCTYKNHFKGVGGMYHEAYFL